MANMSYCRFQNTAGDLRDCVNALEEILAGEDGPLSPSEEEAAAWMEGLCRRFLESREALRDAVESDVQQ